MNDILSCKYVTSSKSTTSILWSYKINCDQILWSQNIHHILISSNITTHNYYKFEGEI